MASVPSTKQALLAENAELRERLDDAEETLRAIRAGEVDALVVEGDAGTQLFILQSSDAESNRFRSDILGKVSDAVIAVDSEQRIIFFNAAAERQYRVSANEVLGRNLSEIYTGHWPSAEAEAATWAALRERGEWRGETIQVLHDGSELHVESSVTMLRSADGSDAGTVAAIRDITERKHGEEHLRAAHDSFRHLVEHSPFGVYAVDADFRLVQVSAGARKVFENVRPLIGRDFAEVLRIIWPESFASEVIAIFRHTLESGDPYHAPNTMEKRADVAEVESYDWKVERITLPDGRPGVVCHFYDLTEWQRYDALRREQEQRLRSLVENSPLSVVEWNHDLVITRWAGEAEATFGWSALEVVGRPIADLGLIYEEDRRVVENVVARLTDGVTRHLTQSVRLQTKDRRVLHCVWHHSALVDGAGETISVLALGEDVTAQKEAEAALLLRTAELRESEERFRVAVRAVSSLIWTNNAQGEMNGEQPGWGNFTGQTFEQYQGYGWAKAVHPDDAQPTIDQWKMAVAEKRTFQFEHRVRRHDGEWRLCSIRAMPVLAPDGRIREWVGVHTDITEQRQAEAEVRAAKEAAETANAAKDRFLAVLSHELRTPLTPVLMTVAALEHDPELRPDVREDLAMMKRNIELETKLIDDLLDLNRITSGKLALTIAPVDLNETIRNVCEMCSASGRERGIRLEMELHAATGLVAADAARLQQVLWNVLKNAIKFTPENGTIRVLAQRLDDSRCEVRVEDSGIGISPEVLPRIFDAFEQGSAKVTRQFGGLGLGLAICKALVELHGGSIRAESPGVGKGATFILEMPGAAAATKATHADAPTTGGEATPQLRLLVVEDHADTARTLTRLLSRAGFAVVAVTDVASAVATAGHESFDVLISDLGLPDGTGYEILSRLGAARTMPGIAMSGYGMDEDIRRSREAGFAEHLVKPIEIPQLIAAIRRVVQ